MCARRNDLSIRKNSKNEAEDYRVYRLSAAEVLRCVAVVLALDLLLSFLFYNSWIPALAAFGPFLLLYLRQEKRRLGRRRNSVMRADFLMAVRMMGDYLRAGYSAEKAVLSSQEELSALLPPKSEILSEWIRMGRAIRNGQTIEGLLSDLAGRTAIEEIRTFCELFSIVRRSGGAIHEITDQTVRELTEQEAVRTEIRTKLSAKVLEQRIMDLMPAAILLYVRAGSPALLTPMYEGTAGRVVMSACLLLYALAFFLSERILRVRE